jgi:hypothetical protein
VRLSYAEGGNTSVYSTVRSLGTLQVVERSDWGARTVSWLDRLGMTPE